MIRRRSRSARVIIDVTNTRADWRNKRSRLGIDVFRDNV